MGIDTFTRDHEIREMHRFAKQKHMLGDLDYAERIYKLLLTEVPLSYEALMNYARLNIQKGKHSEARLLADKVISSFGNDAFALYIRALTSKSLGNERDAIKDAERSLMARPDFIESHHLISELTMRGPKYRDLLSEIHARLSPKIYLEIGVENGTSLSIAESSDLAIGVDPLMKIASHINPNIHLAEVTSDAFFREIAHDVLDGKSIDLTFIDGLHEAHQALRDFINAEKHSSKNSYILMHDVIPLNSATATPDRHTFFWSGDVWRSLIAIKKFFPDIDFITIDSPPTGIAILKKLSPDREISESALSEMYNFMDSLKYDDIYQDRNAILNVENYSTDVMTKIFS